MDSCTMAWQIDTEAFEPAGMKSYVQYLIGDDDIIPNEFLDDEDLSLLSPTNFHQAISA